MKTRIANSPDHGSQADDVQAPGLQTSQTRIPRAERLKAVVLNGSGHAFDTRTGRSYSINPTAQVALLMMQDGKSPSAVVEALSELCAQPVVIVEAGVEHFLEQMTRYVS